MSYLTPQHRVDYERNGYTILDNVFNEQELAAMIANIEGGGGRVSENLRKRADTTGRTANLSLWTDIGDDIWGYATRKPAIVNGVRVLMGEDVAFFHGKVMLKEAKSGGKWEWHQDYGYWYNQGFVFPRMMSAYIALDRATTENGCLQVLSGSHLLGRANHEQVGDQTGIDPRRVSHYEALFETVYCELEPGSVLFFHSNLLHSSAPNLSEHHRRAFILCFNGLTNPHMDDFGHAGAQTVPCPVGTEDEMMQYITSQEQQPA